MRAHALSYLWKQLLRGDRGQALIETALSIPLLLLLLLAAAEFARMAYAGIEVSNAAGAAAAYGASSHAAATDWSVSGSTYSGGVVNAATSDAANLTGVSGLTVTSITTSCSCANSSFTPTGCSDNTTCSSNNTAMVETITVKTQATYDPLIYYPGGPTSIVLHGQATQTVSNQ
ncbi:MAG TPA: TadE/TadG family type IV pilus assembly protein [Terracidiphilus sp.]|nr:TadE/TadG family type IV pilus assembly protein [Terracidiphilus sp.]